MGPFASWMSHDVEHRTVPRGTYQHDAQGAILGEMKLANVARVIAVMAAVVAAGASATSSSNSDAVQSQQMPGSNPPPPQQMDPSRALGLWKSTFGAVKIESDESKGGLQAGSVQGVWVYDRRGEEVVGYFSGSLRGNVMQFKWSEPANPPLVGEGYIVFDPQGRQYSGRWWSERHDRVGDWNGWRQGMGRDAQPQQRQAGYNQGGYGVGGQQGGYGGQSYGGGYSQPPPPPQQPPPPPQTNRTYY